VRTTQLDVGWPLAVALLGLTCFAAVVSRWSRLGLHAGVVTAAARAAVQLAVVSVLVAGIVSRAWWTLAFLGLMFAVATATAARRVTTGRGRWWAGVPIVVGVVPVAVALTAGRVVPARGITLVPVVGILIGGAMTATSLAGRRALDELVRRHGEYEAALSLGFLSRVARSDIARPSAGQALVPALDQTRTVGLVTLPGAFVGMLLGGATPLQAGAVQLFVLVALLAVEVVAVAVTMELVARGLLRADDPPGPA